MNQLTVNPASQTLTTVSSPFSEELYIRFIEFIDVRPKTAETYTKALKRLYSYFAEHEVIQLDIPNQMVVYS